MDPLKQIESLEHEIDNLKREIVDLEDKIESMKNDKDALYQLITDLCYDLKRDADDKTSEALETAKSYVR